MGRMGRMHAGEVNEGLYITNATPYWSRDEHEEEGAPEMKCYN